MIERPLFAMAPLDFTHDFTSSVATPLGTMYGTGQTDFITLLEKVGPFVLLVLVAILGIRFGWMYIVKFSRPR